MLQRCATIFYGLALLTLPWVGVGLLKLATGRDWGGGLQPSWFFLAAAVVCAGLDRARRRSWNLGSGWPAGMKTWPLVGTAAIALAILVSVAGIWLAPVGESLATTLGRYLKQVVQLTIMICFTVWVALWTKGSGRWSWTVKLLLVGGLIQVGYGLVQAVAYYQPTAAFTWLDGVFTSNPSIISGSGELYLADSFRQVPRLRGTVCEPLYLGNFLLFLLPLTLIPVWTARHRGWIAAAFLLLLLATWSRGAWLGLLGQGLLLGTLVLVLGPAGTRGILGIEMRMVRRIILAAAALALVVPLVGVLTGWDSLLYPFRRLVQTFSGQDWSNLTRLYSMQAGWRAWLLSPVIGIGWGQFGWHFPLLVDPLGLQSQFTWPVVNNFPLLILCETGLVGFVVLVGWSVGLGRAVIGRWLRWRRATQVDPAEAWIALGLLAAVLSVAGVWLQLLTFSQYNLPHIWVGLGLLLAALAEVESGGVQT